MHTKEEIKANPAIFENIKIINVADMLTLSPINPKVMVDVTMMNLESRFYLLNSSSSELRNAIPGAYVKNIEEATLQIQKYIDKMVFYDSLLYTIRLKSNQIPIGYIILNSPLCRNNLHEWSLDFWISKEYEGKRIMASSLLEVLGHMQDMEIGNVYAMVDDINHRSKSLLEKLGFGFINTHENSGKNLILYGLRLN